MRNALVACLSATLLAGASDAAPSPRNVSVTFNGETDLAEPLATGVWHAITASYAYPGGVRLLTNTYLVLARGSDQLSGFYVGYHVPTNLLAIVKHGYWNATEGTGAPGQAGRVIENDQGWLDCERSRVEKTDDAVTVTYCVKFKPGVLKGGYNVFMYIEDRDVRHDGFTNMGSIAIGTDSVVSAAPRPAQWSNALKPTGSAAAPVTLASDGQARYQLLVPRDSRPLERKAAAELALHLKLICGAPFAVVVEGTPPSDQRPVISLGRTDLLARSACRWRGADLAAEGYALEVDGANVFLYGGSGRGLLHGVYALLEEDLGCRWYAVGSMDVPRQPQLAVSLVPRRVVPQLELRDPYIHTMHDSTWSLRNKTNTPHAPVRAAWGGSLRYHYMGHTYASYFPTDVYFAKHPEYYALVNGKRQPSQLCHTNADVIRLSIEKTGDIFRSHPEVNVTAIGPNDGRGFCDCPNCQRLDAENGGRAGSFFWFVNQIAAGVKKEFPNNRLISLAYLDYAKPPTKLKVDDYIIIQLCTDSHAWKYQFCPVWESPDYQGYVKAWRAVGARIFLWDYTTDYVHYLVPLANWQVVAENTRFNVRQGVAGIMFESELNDVDEMRAWVWAKQLWNPALDTQALLKDFVFGYFKEAAAPLWDYQMMLWSFWETWHRQPHRCGEPSDNPLLNNLQCSYAPDGPMFTAEFMSAWRRCVEAAERLATNLETAPRVQRAKLPLLYVELAQALGYYTEFGDYSYGSAVRQPKAARQALKPRLDEFRAGCKAHSLSSLGISGSVDKITGKWQSLIDAETVALPRLPLPADWLFATDADDRGVRERWFATPSHFDLAARVTSGTTDGQAALQSLKAGWSRLHINRGVGWEQQGFADFAGPSWYFQNLTLPDDLANKPHLYLYFMGVNEQVWVYLNGELAFERSYASTGKRAGEINGGFSFDARRWLKPGQRNQVAIRVMHATGLGGIWLPAMLIGTDKECTTAELEPYRQ